MTIFTIFFQMLALLIMIGTGFFVSKTGMMDEHTNAQMSRMIVNVFNPLLILSGSANSVGLIPLHTMGIVALIAVGMFAAFIVIGMLLSPLFDREPEQRKIFQMMFVFSNLGFIGIPVVSNILGAEYVVYVNEFMLIYTIVFYTYGVALMDGKFSPASLKAMINPGTIFGLASMLVIIFEISPPEFVRTAITYLGNVASPMALVAVGFSAVKLLGIPLLLLPLLRLAAPDRSLVSVCMVLFGMPIGNMPLILGTQKGIDGSTCSAAIILTTLLCVFTIPVLLTVVG